MFTINLHNINLADVTPRDSAGYARRLRNIAAKIREDVANPWQLICLNECKAQREGAMGPVYEAERIECLATNQRQYTAECFAADLGAPDAICEQYGEIGIIARSEIFERVDGHRDTGLIGYKWPGTVRRQVLGLRLRVRATGDIVHVYSTHISAFEDHWYTKDEIRTQLEELRDKIRETWHPGDVTPLLAGDFNSRGWDASKWKILGEDFLRVQGELAGKIEHVYCGHAGSFANAAGFWRVDRTAYVDVDDNAVNLSDHSAPFVVLTGPMQPDPSAAPHRDPRDEDRGGARGGKRTAIK